MDKEIKKWIAIISIVTAVLVIVLLLLSGYNISGFKIHKGIKIN